MGAGNTKVTLKAWLEQQNRTFDEKLQAAIAITNMVYSLHTQQEIIGTLSPVNIIVGADAAVARIAEVGERNEAYRAPEQSGRMQSAPDRRSDLYTLGVIFYEIFTGVLPFQRQSKEDWGYVHLAVTPLHISKVRPDVSTVIASIIMKLLYKDANERYQSAYGLLYDLRQFVHSTSAELNEHNIEIGKMDRRRVFRHPIVQYQIKKEVDQLEKALQQLEASKSAFITVIGEQGTGKTMLASHLTSMAQGKGIWCITGSGGAERQPSAYDVLRVAFNQWFEQLWTQEEAVIAVAKGKLEQLMGEDLSLLTDWLQSAQVVWSTSLLSNSPSQWELLLRLEKWLPHILNCMTEISGQLLFMIDNMQWVDDKTRLFLNHAMDNKAHGGLLLLMLGRTELIEKDLHTSTTVIPLHALHFDEVRRWISLLLHEDSARVRMLAKAAYEQTEGNAGALRRLLDDWYSKQRLSYNEERHEWMWDVELLGLQKSDPAAQSRLWEEGCVRLTEAEKQVVSIAAIIGQQFELSTVADVYQLPADHVFDMLKVVEREGWICMIHQDEVMVSYLFLDEYVRSALYEQRSREAASWHLKIGKSLHKHALHRSEDQQEHLYMKHLILGSSEMSNHERRQLAIDNVELGKKYYEMCQYAESKHYFDFVVSQYPDLDEDNEPFVYQSWLYIAVCEHFCGDIEGSRRRYEVLANYVDRLDRIDRVHFYINQIKYFTFNNDELAVEYGRKGFEIFGWTIPEKVTKLSVVKEILLTQKELSRARSRGNSFVHNEDPEYIEFCLLISVMLFPLLKINPGLILVLYARFIRYGLKQGVNSFLLCIIGTYEIIIQRAIPTLFDKMPTRALDTLQVSSYTTSLSISHYLIPYVVALYKQLDHSDETASYLQKAMLRSLQYSDSVFTSLALTTFIVTHNGRMQVLEDQIVAMENDPRYVIDLTMASFIDSAKQYCQSIKNIENLLQFIAIPEGGNSAGNDNYICIAKLEVAYVAGHYREALFWAQEGSKLEFTQDWIQNRKIRVYQALCYAAIYAQATELEQASIIKLLNKRIHRMRKWKGFYGLGSAMHVLIQAERLKLTGKVKKAHGMYEAAVIQAKSERNGLVEGITTERLAVYYVETGSSSGSTVSLLDACAAYSSWGISAKVDLLKDKHSELWRYLPQDNMDRDGTAEQQKQNEMKLTNNQPRKMWSEENATRWMQEIADWSIRYERNVFEQFLLIALRQVGGDRGYIFRYSSNDFHVEACSDRNNRSSELSNDAMSVVRQVYISQSPFIMNRNDKVDRAIDRQLEETKVASIMALPIQLPNEQEPLIVYLENSHVSHAFHERSVNVIALMITRFVYFVLMQNNENSTSDMKLESTSMVIESLIDPLSNRELEVLQAIVEGMSNKEIAENLDISETTVKKHTSNIYGKLQVKRRGQAIAKARELELIG